MKKTPACILAALVLLPRPGGSFQRSRDAETLVCTWWSHRSVLVHMNENGVPGLALAEVESTIRAALDVWNRPDCSDFSFVYDGLSESLDIGYDQAHPRNNQNLILYVGTGWQRTSKHELSALALTTVTYDTCTGLIVDADVELNGEFHNFTTADPPQSEYDILNTLAHEVGHMLGLDHSDNAEATMYSYAEIHEIKKRDLSQDDLDGLCYLYPANQPVPFCENASPPATCDSGCSCTFGSVPRATVLILIGLGILALLRHRKT